MGSHIVRTESYKAVKVCIKKWGKFSVDNGRLRGEIKITNYRKYSYYEEVDVEFKGEVFFRIGPIGKNNPEWHSANVKERLRKIQLNRFLRKIILQDVQSRLNLFSVGKLNYSDIKKINWL